MTKKYEVVIIDTINQLQNDLYIDLLDKKNRGANFDEWRDFGVEILSLFRKIKTLPADIILVLGAEGTGKTVGGKTLNPETTMWLNCDKKPLTFLGARKLYNKDAKNYTEPSTYKEVEDKLEFAHENKKSDRLIVFVIGHTEVYKAIDGNRERLKILGKMATKHNLEGAVSHCYYTFVDSNEKDESKRYKLTTKNSGYNTARSPEGYWESMMIPNDYQLIIDKINSDR